MSPEPYGPLSKRGSAGPQAINDYYCFARHCRKLITTKKHTSAYVLLVPAKRITMTVVLHATTKQSNVFTRCLLDTTQHKHYILLRRRHYQTT